MNPLSVGQQSSGDKEEEEDLKDQFPLPLHKTPGGHGEHCCEADQDEEKADLKRHCVEREPFRLTCYYATHDRETEDQHRPRQFKPDAPEDQPMRVHERDPGPQDHADKRPHQHDRQKDEKLKEQSD